MADYNAAPQVQESNTCELYGKVYRLRQQGNMPPVQVTMSTQYPVKLVIGDYGRNDNPLISTYTVEDLRGGMGLYRYRVGATQGELDRFWTSQNINSLWGNAITLAPVATSLGRPIGSTLKTTNGGTTWTAQSSGSGNAINGIAAPSATVAWMVGASGVILKTTDGGTTWTSQTSGVVTALNAVAAVDTNTAWAVGAGGVILITTNGGTTWTAQTSGVPNQGYWAVGAATASAAYVAGDNGYILQTLNGGLTWTSQQVQAGNSWRGIAVGDQYNAWVVGSAGYISRTQDGGNWNSLAPQAAALNGATAFDTQTVWAVGAAGTLIASTNGGTTWTAQTSGVSTALNAIAMASATVLWAVGASGVILKTTNGGTTWTSQTSGITAALNAVAAPSTTVVFTGGLGNTNNLGGVVGTLGNSPVAAFGTQLYNYGSAKWSALLDTFNATPVGNPVVFGGKIYYPMGASGYAFQSTATGALTQVATPLVASFVIWDNKLYALDTAFALWSSTTGASGSWGTSLATVTLDSTFTNPYGQLAVYDNAAGDLSIWALTHQGPFTYDAVNAKWFRSRFQFPYNQVGAVPAYGAAFRESLFLLSSPASVAKLTSGGGTLLVDDASPNRPDGYAGAFAGATLQNWIADDAFLFTLLSSPTKNGLLVWNGRGWHNLFTGDTTTSNPVKGIIILGTTLYFADFIAAGSVGYVFRTMDLSSLSGLRANPIVSTTLIYTTSGFVETPWFDGGYEAQQKLALQVRIKVLGLTTTSETVQLQYATDFDETSYQTLGTITSTTAGISGGRGEITYRFPWNGNLSAVGYVGAAFKALKWRLTLGSGGATNAPKVEYIALDFLRIPQTLRGFQITIDCNEDSPDGRAPATQIADLWAAISSTTQGTFAYRDDAGNTQSYLCKVMRPQGQEQTGEDPRGMYTVYVVQFGNN